MDAEDGTVRTAQIALGGVAHKPWRTPQAEGGTSGLDTKDGRSLASAAETFIQGARGAGHNDFKIELAQRTIARTVAEAAA